MRVLRAFALVANGLWAAVWIVLLAASIARPDIGWAVLLTFLALGVISAVVIWKDLRGHRAAKPLRVAAVTLNAGFLAFAAIGWSTALTGGAGPTNVEGAVAAAVMTVLAVLNLILILRQWRSARLAPEVP